jgi:oxalate decarboxylase/phosphoglucose isomerase-like protein (cupin superfamily)
MTSVSDCQLVQLPRVQNRSGNISIFENADNLLPFSVKRIFYLYDIPGGESRGAHAHKNCHQFLVAASGSFEVILDDGKTVKSIWLNQADIGLHVPPGIWASEVNFSSGSICLVLASEEYDESDYLREYNDFQQYKK